MTELQLAPSSPHTPPLFATAVSRARTPIARKTSVLLVEDQPSAIAAAFGALDRADYEVELATPASLAAGLLEDRVFDVILISLAHAAGIGATIRVKRLTDTPVIALVGGRDFFQTIYQLRMATTLGAAASVMKPLAAERLRVAIAQAGNTAHPFPGQR